MLHYFFSLACFALHFSQSFGAYCSGKPNSNALPNSFGSVAAEPQLIGATDNGKLYTVGPDDQQFYLVHIYGDPYQMGYAHGTLLRPQIQAFVTEVWQYILDEIPLHEIYPELANFTVEEALQLQADATRPYTPDYWFEEIRGLADATGLDYDSILRIHMLPELTKGSCSMFGAWGNATASLQGKLLQLRALDWDTDGPFKNYPALVVYHPSNGHTFANLGFTGWIGSITGVSSKRMSISEIGVSFPDSTFGKESRFGYPFVFVLRDILQFDDTVENTTNRLNTTHRTCDLILGAGSGPETEFRGYEYSYSTLKAFDWYDLEPYNQTWHPRIENIVYWGMDWLCPGYNQVLSEQLLAHYGNITTENSISDIVAITQTGNLHIAIYDYSQDMVFISLHAKTGDNSVYQNAYERQYVSFDLSDLFEEN